ncbi:DUF938 domain-containing protein [Pelagerythrobacter sp.]|uniref:DUF938 domain-containing protein n=1 Tax=Pelagerythrobacter sp. TaxID=2800702 RepID=UPI0035B1736B
MKRHAPATARNSAPIADVLAGELPERGTVLELASGSGEHAVFFARRFANLRWQPSDPDPGARASIAAWRDADGPANLLAPIAVDAAAPQWPIAEADAVVCINMIHISPWAATEGLFAGAAGLLAHGAPLIVYGPFLEADIETAPSNIAFDVSLRGRDAAWGLRDRAAVDRVAADAGFTPGARYAMPANNLTLVYRRS